MKAVVVAVSGLQLGYVGCYGNDWILTPTLDRLAAEGVVFDGHLADRADAAGARHAWQTGRHPFGDKNAGPNELVALLRRQGVTTALAFDGERPPPKWFRTGWENALPDEVLDLVNRLAERDRWLLWIDWPALVPPWEVPEELERRYLDEAGAGEEEPLPPLDGSPPEALAADDDATFLRLQAAYAAAVTQFDADLGDLLEAFERRDLLDDLFLVVTADRGWPLGEHGSTDAERAGPYEELVHLPLILRLPGGEEAGRRVPALTQPVDLMPTVLEYFGVAAPAVHGHSLWSLARGSREEVRAYACSGVPRAAGWQWALRTPAWALVLPAPGQEQLFVKPADRWEVNDVRQHRLELAERYEATLRAYVAASREPGPLRAPALPDVEEAAHSEGETP
jgi:arylsulfatase A-like enzyme